MRSKGADLLTKQLLDNVSCAVMLSETRPMIRKQLLSSRIQNTARDADLDEAPILESAGQVGQLIEWRMGSRCCAAPVMMMEIHLRGGERLSAACLSGTGTTG